MLCQISKDLLIQQNDCQTNYHIVILTMPTRGMCCLNTSYKVLINKPFVGSTNPFLLCMRKVSSIAHLLTMSLRFLLQHFTLACHRWQNLHGIDQILSVMFDLKRFGDPIPLLNASYAFARLARICLERSAVPDPLPPYQCPYECLITNV